jgi:hypothetical protein
MEWDLNEPEALTTARLMVASPEFVYEQLKFYGKQTVHFPEKWKVEAALLTRDDKLIDLALAQFASDNKVMKTLYDRANSVTNDKDEYNLGLRVACLSNRNFDGDGLGRGWGHLFGLEAVFAKGCTPECEALLTNPTIDTDVLESLYRKSEYFGEVDEKTWLDMIFISARNERLRTENESPHDPDYGLMGINVAIFNFLEVAPVSVSSIGAAKFLLDSLVVTIGVSPKEISPVLKRWGEVEEKGRGLFTRLTETQELRCLIAALYCHRDPETEKELGPFGSPDDPDVALRCAFYAEHDLSEAEMKAGYKKDQEIFLYAVLKHKYLLEFYADKRALIEDYLGRESVLLRNEYCRLCEQIHKTDKCFDPRPVSEAGRKWLEVMKE